MDIYRKFILKYDFFVLKCPVKVLTDFIEKFIQMSYSHSCADKIQKGGRPSLTALSGDLKKSASDPPEKRQKKCLLETRTKIGLTDKYSGTNGQFCSVWSIFLSV